VGAGGGWCDLGALSDWSELMNDIHVRWMIRSDMPDVLEIERLCFEFPAIEQDFIQQLRQRNCIGMVVEAKDVILGFMIYELHRDKLELLDFAVLPAAQGKGVGTAMINKLVNKLDPNRRRRVCLNIRDTNLDAHLWFARRGFTATKIIRSPFDDVDEDAYRFVYRVQQTVEAS
jgi:ribosomal-protein-alanine N-acetyltransferase